VRTRPGTGLVPAGLCDRREVVDPRSPAAGGVGVGLGISRPGPGPAEQTLRAGWHLCGSENRAGKTEPARPGPAKIEWGVPTSMCGGLASDSKQRAVTGVLGWDDYPESQLRLVGTLSTE
jgi:hypothetical protein